MSRRPHNQDRIIWDQLFAVSPDSATTLQAQLREQAVAAILDGFLPSDEPLPSCRELARHLGVARNTVVRAYENLVDEGYLIPRRGSGYYINPGMLHRRVEFDPSRDPEDDRFDWSKRLGAQPSVHRNTLSTHAWNQYPYPFVYEQPDPELIPIAGWRECCRETLSVSAMRKWAADKAEFDDPLLVKQIQTRLLPRRGIWVSPEEILITTGAQQALFLIASLLVTNRTAVGLEDPGCVDVRRMFALRTSGMVGLPVDEAGLVVDNRLDYCDYVYVTPGHQCPTTVKMSMHRRRRLLERAAAADVAVIEDDYESDADFLGDASPALKSLDRDGRVIYVGSISRSLVPGLCLGYLVAPPALIREIRALRQLMFRHPFRNHQRTFALFLARGYYDALLCRLNRTYKERWHALRDALARYLPDETIMPPSGGTAFWVKGLAAVDARELQRNARTRGILIEPGEPYFLSGCAPRRYFRLGFSSIPVDRIEPGVRMLAELIHQKLATPN